MSENAALQKKSSLLRTLLQNQIWLSRKIDSLLDPSYRRDGNRDFQEQVVPPFIRPAMVVYDIGGGSRPYLSATAKQEKSLTVVGTDISKAELEAAPPGAYDRTVCADITQYTGAGDADLVICQAVMEHVRDADGAFRGIATTLKPGGHALIFVPSRNAAFARLNLLLPESWKRRILFTLFPHKAEGHDGFPAFYDQATPARYRALAKKHGLEVVKIHPYYVSSYFSICAPVYALWRLWIVAFRALCAEEAAETFSVILRKPPSGPVSG